jgi:hypothetical protein
MSAKFEGKPPFYLGILGAHCRSVTWPRQSGISGPRRTAPAELRGGASFCSTAAAGRSAGDLSGSTEEKGAGDALFGSTAAAAGCASFGSTGSTEVSGARGVLFGSTAEAADLCRRPPDNVRASHHLRALRLGQQRLPTDAVDALTAERDSRVTLMVTGR